MSIRAPNKLPSESERKRMMDAVAGVRFPAPPPKAPIRVEVTHGTHPRGGRAVRAKEAGRAEGGGEVSGKLVLHGSQVTLKSKTSGPTEPISLATFRMGAWILEIPVVTDPASSLTIFGGADGRMPSRIRIEIYAEEGR